MQFFITDEYKVITKSMLRYFDTINKLLSKNKKNYLYDVTIINSKEMSLINKKYRNVNKTTDVISFAFYDAKNSIKTTLLGEIFINYEMCLNKEKSFRYELALLFTHGLLHLLGHDHMRNSDYKKMMDIQFNIMKQVNLLK